MGIRETFLMATFNRANHVTGIFTVSVGGIVGTVVETAFVAKVATETLSKAVVLCHNHTSGATAPSEADKILTLKIKEALKLLDCMLMDHLILTETSHFSFAEEGIM